MMIMMAVIALLVDDVDDFDDVDAYHSNFFWKRKRDYREKKGEIGEKKKWEVVVDVFIICGSMFVWLVCRLCSCCL